MTRPIDHDEDNRDERTASVYRAIALRFYARYIAAQHKAQFRGGDLPNAEPVCTERAASDQYKSAVESAIYEPVDTANTALALVELAGVIAADNFLTEATREGFGIAEEVDALHQVVALAAAGDVLNKIVMREWADKQLGHPRCSPVQQ